MKKAQARAGAAWPLITTYDFSIRHDQDQRPLRWYKGALTTKGENKVADAPVVHIGENSPEHIAHRLMHEIAIVEGKSFQRSPGQGFERADRKWRSHFAECLNGPRTEIEL